MNELPSTSSGSKNEGHLNASTHKAILLLTENAESQRRQELLERRAERERYLQVQIRQREREMRLLNMENIQHNGPRPPGQDIHLDDPYDSSESGYWSIKDRRPKTRTEQMWSRMRARERRLRDEKERQKKEEDKQELDAMFHVMLHGSDELVVSDGSEYEYKLPEFMKFDEIKRGFDEQMKRETAIRKKREEAERKAADSNEEEFKLTPSNFKNQWGHAISGYNFPPIITDWSMESNATIKKEENPQQEGSTVIEVYASSDEEDNSTTAITKRAMKWANCSTNASTSTIAGTAANSNCTATSSAIITVHDSDSE